MLHAIKRGAKELIIGVGGSSTNDGGMGMAAALGYEFLDHTGRSRKGYGQDLFDIVKLSDRNRDPRLDDVKITIAADVENPLLGTNGATYVYGPQKGVSSDMLVHLDNAMDSFYVIAGTHFEKDVRNVPGSGAGGGMGAGLLIFANAKIKKGIELVLEHLHVKEVCKEADIVIVGEGRIDGQTVYGKAPIGVAACAPQKAKVIAICGSVGTDSEALYDHGIDAIFPTIQTLAPIETVMERAYSNIEKTSRNIAALLVEK